MSPTRPAADAVPPRAFGRLAPNDEGNVSNSVYRRAMAKALTQRLAHTLRQTVLPQGASQWRTAANRPAPAAQLSATVQQTRAAVYMEAGDRDKALGVVEALCAKPAAPAIAHYFVAKLLDEKRKAGVADCSRSAIRRCGFWSRSCASSPRAPRLRARWLSCKC